MIDNVKTKGYVKFYEPGISDLVSLDEHTLTNTEERQRDITVMRLVLRRRYLCN